MTKSAPPQSLAGTWPRARAQPRPRADFGRQRRATGPRKAERECKRRAPTARARPLARSDPSIQCTSQRQDSKGRLSRGGDGSSSRRQASARSLEWLGSDRKSSELCRSCPQRRCHLRRYGSRPSACARARERWFAAGHRPKRTPQLTCWTALGVFGAAGVPAQVRPRLVVFIVVGRSDAASAAATATRITDAFRIADERRDEREQRRRDHNGHN